LLHPVPREIGCAARRTTPKCQKGSSPIGKLPR
jgi:hypothetical protein